MGIMTTGRIPEFETILDIARGLAPAEVWMFTAQLRGLLDSVEPDPASAADAHLRALIEAFLAGFTIGHETAGE